MHDSCYCRNENPRSAKSSRNVSYNFSVSFASHVEKNFQAKLLFLQDDKIFSNLEICWEKVTRSKLILKYFKIINKYKTL